MENHKRCPSHDTITTSTSSQDLKPTHEELSTQKGEKGLSALSVINILQKKDDHIAKASTTLQVEEKQLEARQMDVGEESGRERLKRHRVEMSGHVWIPDTWGQEDLLKSWIDSTVFDSSLEKSNIMSARDALIQEGRSTTFRIENSC